MSEPTAREELEEMISRAANLGARISGSFDVDEEFEWLEKTMLNLVKEICE